MAETRATKGADGAAGILVTGSHRSATTWVGRVLEAAGGFGYIREPFNAERRPGWMRAPMPHRYEYITGDGGPHLRDVERLLQFRVPILPQLRELGRPRDLARLLNDWRQGVTYRVQGRRPLIKDPFALFSAPWLADTFGLGVVITIRHPAGFVSSVRRFGWRFDFRHWLDQPALIRDLLADWERMFRTTELDPVGEAAMVWRGIYGAVARFRTSRPSWIFVRHEDLALDPRSGFQDLAKRVGIEWTDSLERFVGRSSSAENPVEGRVGDTVSVTRNSRELRDVWKKRLSPVEVDRIRSLVEPVAGEFYTEDEW
jgi:hypothetical protein